MNREIWRGQLTPLFLVVLLIAVACRIYDLDYASLWADEMWGLEACSRGSWWAMIDNLINKDSHPPGYQTMLYFWIQLFGDSDFTVRMPSVIAGVGAVAATYHFGARFFSPLLGLFAAALLATSHNAIFYSQEARAYPFLMLFAISHLHIFCHLFLYKQTATRYWPLFWLTGALLAYFHYVGVVILLAEAMLLPFLLPAGSRIKLLLRAFLPIFLLYVPWLPAMYKHMFHGDASFNTEVPGWDKLVETARFVWGPNNFRFYTGMLTLSVLFIVCARESLKRALTPRHKLLLLLVTIVVLPLLLFFVKSHLGASSYTVRHFIYILPVVALINAWLLERLFVWIRPQYGAASVGVFLAVVIAVCIDQNISDQQKYGGKLYKDVWKMEYRQSVALIATDTEFMESEKENVFFSNLFFQHYLKKIGASRADAPFFHHDEPHKMPEYVDYIRKQHIKNFYYLGVVPNIETREYSPLAILLRKQYYTTCITNLFWVRIIKFSTQLPPNPDDRLHRCPRKAPVDAQTSDDASEVMPQVSVDVQPDTPPEKVAPVTKRARRIDD